MKTKKPNDRGLVARQTTNKKAIWYVRLRHNGRVRWFGSFPSKTEARNFYQDAKTDQRRGKFFPEVKQKGGILLKEVIDSYMSTNINRSRKNDEHYSTFYKERWPRLRLKNLTPALLEEVKHEKIKKGLAPQSVKHYLKFLRRVLNVAIRDGKLERNPFVQVDMPKVSNGRLRYLSLEEEGELCKAIGSTYSPWIRFAILTGLRQEEQFKLKWKDIDPTTGVITLGSTKNGDVQYVQLTREAKNIIETLKKGNASIWVFPSKDPESHRDPKNFYHRQYRPALEKAKLEDVTWHTLRHTFASRLAMSGATEGDIAACLRHSTTALVRRYAHLSPTHLKGVMEKVTLFGMPKPKEEKIESVDKSEIEGKARKTGTSKILK